MKILQKINGMNLMGQGGKIILMAVPSLLAAILVPSAYPKLAYLPDSISIVSFVGYIFIIPGILLWLTGLIQLLTLFPQGKLITNAAYYVCRNPIYSSFICFILPGITLLTLCY